jgi:hypothetical protein
MVQLKDVINTMVSNLSVIMGEAPRVPTEIGTQGLLGRELAAPGIEGE